MKILCILACVLGILSPMSTVSICKPDLGLVIDTTESIRKKIPDLREALADLVQKINISEHKTHVSLETFSKRAHVRSNFSDSKYWSVDAVLKLVNLSTSHLTSPTRLDRALEAANDKMFTKAYGDRPGEVNVLVLFTDGRSHRIATDNDTLTSSVKSLKNKGVLLIAVAIGRDSGKKKYQEVLKQIAGKNVIKLDDYASPDKAMDDVVKLICFSICKPDLGLVVDTTKSIQKDITDLQNALADFVQKFDISEDKTHVSLETFSKKAQIHNKFSNRTFWSVDTILNLVKSSTGNLASPTRLDRALEMANDKMFTEANGDRPGERNVLVVFTDGRSHSKTDNNTLTSSIENLKDKGVLVIAVAFGRDSRRNRSQTLLKKIAGKYVFPGLDTVDEVFNLICRVDEEFPNKSDWSDCKDGMQERTRTCTNPISRRNEKDCEGLLKKKRSCPQKRASRIGRISAIEGINLE